MGTAEGVWQRLATGERHSGNVWQNGRRGLERLAKIN
jgi:hypothetical protein